MSDYLDYENNLAFDPTSADDLNEQGRQSDVLVAAIEKCEKLEKEMLVLQKQLDIAEEALKQYANKIDWLTGYDALGNGGTDCIFYCNGYETADKALNQIKELDK